MADGKRSGKRWHGQAFSATPGPTERAPFSDAAARVRSRRRSADHPLFEYRVNVCHLYGLVWYFIPNSFTNIPTGPHWQADGTIVYFSFVTLTSTGFGDVTPLHPIVRTLSNMEAIIVQLFPATLLARLITLELRGYRQRS